MFPFFPNKLDITQIVVDYKRFERAAIWQEFWFGREQEQAEKPIFKTPQKKLSKNHQTFEGLKVFLGAVKSEIQDPRNRNTTECNLPHDEIEALKELQRLQKEREIVIKECDKGAHILILTFKEYMRACYQHLTSEQLPGNPYYSPVNGLAVEETKTKIKNVLEEGLEN